jgi:uncharacterized protein
MCISPKILLCLEEFNKISTIFPSIKMALEQNQIIGREKEKAIFDKLLQSNQAEFLVVYGRRRVGKTFAIRQYFQSNFVMEFSGSNQDETAIQLYNFHNEFKRYAPDKASRSKPKNWAEAFANLTDYLYSIEDKSKKMVVFIDELPWLDTPKSGLVAALDYFWNQHGSKMNHLLLIVCGSAASWIQKNLLHAKGGLYNRITKRIFLQPFTLHEVEKFCLSKNLKFTRYQLLQLYMVMGGIPFYLKELEQGKSVSQLIDQICFKTGGLLSDEFKSLYHSLFTKAENHIKMVETLATCPYGVSRKDLVEKTGVPDGGTFSRTIENLIDCGFVLEITPFGKKAKDKVYRIIDLYSIFYLKFIKGNVTNRNHTWESLASYANYESWAGYAFENVGLLHQEQIHKKLGISGVYTEVSSWRYRGDLETEGTQIDLVIDRKDGIIHLCEAKFSSKDFLMSKEYTAKLRKRRAIFEYATKTKKAIVSTLLTVYPAIENGYYLEEIHSEINAEDLFVER